MQPEVTNVELAKEIEAGSPPLLLDVREAYELDYGTLPNIVHIPMIEVPERLNELDKDRDIVVVCRTGSRSSKITNFLLAQGYTKVRNLVDGMNGWSSSIDPKIEQY